MGARVARARALGVLRIRGRALAVALLPAAVFVILLVAGATERLTGAAWDVVRWVVGAVAVVVLLCAVGVGLVVARARPALSPTVPIPEHAAPDLYRLVRELADRLGVPAPSAIALTPDCDSWLEDRTHRAHRGHDVVTGASGTGVGSGASAVAGSTSAPATGSGSSSSSSSGSGSDTSSRGDDAVAGAGGAAGHEEPGGGTVGESRTEALASASTPVSRPVSHRVGTGGTGVGTGADARDGVHGRGGPLAPVLVIGSPFLWWMRVGELRAVLAPVVAGTEPSAHPDIAAARRFVRGLDAAVAVSAAPGRGPLARVALAGVGWVTRLMLRGCRVHAAEMERGVAAAAAERAQAVDYGPRIMAQEQVGLAYAGWDRLLTKVALPAWRMGRWPSRLDAGVVAALTELSRRDRLADNFSSRLNERPACDLLEEPGAMDEAASLLAARLFHGGPAEPGPDWAPIDWQSYPDEVVDRKWRSDAARLHKVLDGLGEPQESASAGELRGGEAREGAHTDASADAVARTATDPGPTLARVVNQLSLVGVPFTPAPAVSSASTTHPTDIDTETGISTGTDTTSGADRDDRASLIAAALSAELSREEASGPGAGSSGGGGTGGGRHGSAADAEAVWWGEGMMPLFPLQPPRTARELLADHVRAMVCCAAVDTAGAAPGLDWLDGPSLLIDGQRDAGLGPLVLSLVEDGDPEPLKDWLADRGVRADKPVRLV
ncbi:hypothetical protein HUT18_17880 [Streptomyces sp. NA04227]|uniref:hypothetical protein n=1 Tax=Streptomyces sp. NA04227 TaxID=2742136 RepID=UPI00159188B7|nr:hypothetical protein [Streptomyces sp. NA04227]QKW07978.1 hypothetical protein HUT18_17880 [Streptomyces sp. NA04227]